MGPNDQLAANEHTPIGQSTNVLLDHFAIDVESQQILIYCNILDDIKLTQNMNSLKGYTVIAMKGFGSSSLGTEWRWGGSGRIANLLEQDVSVLIQMIS